MYKRDLQINLSQFFLDLCGGLFDLFTFVQFTFLYSLLPSRTLLSPKNWPWYWPWEAIVCRANRPQPRHNEISFICWSLTSVFPANIEWSWDYPTLLCVLPNLYPDQKTICLGIPLHCTSPNMMSPSQYTDNHVNSIPLWASINHINLKQISEYIASIYSKHYLYLIELLHGSVSFRNKTFLWFLHFDK